ncbi:hypothetical protein KQI86_17040 [Clostridium sp. MSJ-11]|uniref:Uncharacterized protein n=1 Tax=Clostridium mobile TaxID=2841512 RepID=A0ABS6ELD6_9CLOT|nr:DUF5692 family protein [Clostridium mobile]MBU5486029.1 hypothetical protein [Clostridium mobile]
MFQFNYAEGATMITAWGMWFIVLISLFLFNEFSRRQKWAGFFSFVILPIILTVVWFTVLRDVTYTDWFHLAKVYSATAGCIGFWCIRHIEKKDKKTGEVIWRLADNKIALCFPPLILAINILEAVARDIEVGYLYWMTNSGPIEGEVIGVMGGIWNYMNAAAGILSIITITGWLGIVIRKETKKDKSRDMLWPDMLWFWIIAYDLWNFVYTYNCIPTHSWYAGLALLIAPTLCAFTIGKGAWLQHRAQTLAIWCMFAQTFPSFQDTGMFVVKSTYNPTIYTVVAALALAVNVAVFIYMIYKMKKTKRKPYTGEIYIDLGKFKEVKMMS